MALLLDSRCIFKTTKIPKWFVRFDRAVAANSCRVTHILCCLHWLKITERIRFKLLSLKYKVLTTTHICISSSLFNRLLDNSRIRQLADWTTRGCHRRLCVLSFRSFGGICESASCPVRELAIRELAYPRVVQLPPRSTRSSSLVTLAQPPTSSSLYVTDRSFRYASPCL